MRPGYGWVARFSSILLLALAPSARSAGINLSWNDCGDFGSANQSFDCAGAGGAPLKLIASYTAPAGIGEFLGVSSELQIFSQQPALQDWWKHGSGQCRGTSALSVGFDFTSGPSNCADIYGGQGMGGLSYEVGYASPSSARLRIQGAIPFDNKTSLDSGVEYYAYQLVIARGSPTCGGCSDVACVALLSIQLFQPPEAAYDPEITQPASRAFVSWQAAAATPCTAGNKGGSRTWGQVKTLYRR